MNEKALDRIESSIAKLDCKFDKIEDKLDRHLERIAVTEEHSKTNRGAIAILYTAIMTMIGWAVYKLL